MGKRISRFYKKNETASIGFLHREHRSKKGRNSSVNNCPIYRIKKEKLKLNEEYDYENRDLPL